MVLVGHRRCAGDPPARVHSGAGRRASRADAARRGGPGIPARAAPPRYRPGGAWLPPIEPASRVWSVEAIAGLRCSTLALTGAPVWLSGYGVWV
jgi:hypothetical protein